MRDCERCIVIELAFDRALGAVIHAIRDEGLEVIGSTDVREHFKRTIRHDFRKYVLIEAWSPELAFEALLDDVQAGALMPTTVAVYELSDDNTAIVVHHALLSGVADRGCEGDTTDLRRVANRDGDRIGRVLARLRHVPRRDAAHAA